MGQLSLLARWMPANLICPVTILITMRRLSRLMPNHLMALITPCPLMMKISTPTHLRLKTLRKNMILTPVILVVRRMREVDQDQKEKKVKGGRRKAEKKAKKAARKKSSAP